MARLTTRPSGGGYDTARSGSWLTILAIAVIAGLVVVALRAFGAIESLELRAHDQFVRLRNGPPTPQPRRACSTPTARPITR